MPRTKPSRGGKKVKGKSKLKVVTPKKGLSTSIKGSKQGKKEGKSKSGKLELGHKGKGNVGSETPAARAARQKKVMLLVGLAVTVLLIIIIIVIVVTTTGGKKCGDAPLNGSDPTSVGQWCAACHPSNNTVCKDCCVAQNLTDPADLTTCQGLCPP